ncbi:histidine phosphatase family protein [Pendulispora albinea]|uniref:Histidine phosphatase family protein n=1 Tax=Pendulispora albinea TaxID=2741071 RepID=A0ABZ2M7U3_9BACT
MGDILLIRHAQASFGSANYDCLSELGLEQSRLLGRWLARRGRTIDRVAMGHMQRHRQTAEAALAELPTELRGTEAPIVDAGFDEFDGDHVLTRYRPELAERSALAQHLAQSSHPYRAFQELFEGAVERWVAGQHDGEYRESWNAFRARCVLGLERLVQGAGPSRTLAVFTSGGPITAICQHLLELPDRRAFDLNWPMANSAVTALRYRPDRISLNYLNNFSHLERAGQPPIVTYR